MIPLRGGPSPAPGCLTELARLRRFEKGEYFYRPADRMDWVYVIRRGAVKVGGYGPDGRERIYDILGPGEFCGNLGYLGGKGGFEEFVRALEQVEVTAYPVLRFKELFREDVAVHEWFVRLMVRRWARAEMRLFRIASMRPRERVHMLLKELAATDPALPGQLTQEDLANLTGLTRQTVAKLLTAPAEARGITFAQG